MNIFFYFNLYWKNFWYAISHFWRHQTRIAATKIQKPELVLQLVKNMVYFTFLWLFSLCCNMRAKLIRMQPTAGEKKVSPLRIYSLIFVKLLSRCTFEFSLIRRSVCFREKRSFLPISCANIRRASGKCIFRRIQRDPLTSHLFCFYHFLALWSIFSSEKAQLFSCCSSKNLQWLFVIGIWKVYDEVKLSPVNSTRVLLIFRDWTLFYDFSYFQCKNYKYTYLWILSLSFSFSLY